MRRLQEDPASRVFLPVVEYYRRSGRLDEAIDICREGLEHNPDYQVGRIALARCYLDKKWFAEARVELERVIGVSPESLLGQRLLGDACLALRDPAAALHAYKMAMLLSPTDVVLAEKVHSLELAVSRARRPPPADEFMPEDRATAPEAAPAPVEKEMGGEPLWPAPEEKSDWQVGPANETPQMWREEELTPDPPEPVDDGNAFTLEVAAEEARRVESEEPDPSSIDELLGMDSTEESPDAFQTEHVSAIFREEKTEADKGITTSTLGDLYFAQGQFDQALRIFEKLEVTRPSPELTRKIQQCRARLGLDPAAILRNRQMESLRSVLKKVREPS